MFPLTTRGRLLLAALVTVGVLLVLLSVLLFPRLLAPPLPSGNLDQERVTLEEERLKTQNAVRTTLLQAVGGLVLLVGAAATLASIQINREGQITERFTRAIEQLGSDKGDDIVLGGLYALDRIAKDSERDRETVLQILSAYVRGHAAIEQDRTAGNGEWPPLRHRAPAVQAALSLLAYRVYLSSSVRLRLRLQLDLSGVDISRAELARADLSGVDLSGANLIWANLMRANLTGADLSKANLTRAILIEANLSGAPLILANLGHAFLGRALLRGALLSGANLSGALLSGADLSGAYLGGADLSGADLSGANLSGAYFGVPILGGAGLNETDFGAADLSGADLSGADLSGANLGGANLNEANLNGAVGFTDEQTASSGDPQDG